MHRRNNLSKSTKRRRLLDEKNYIETLSHNDSFITLPSAELNNTYTIVTNKPLIEPTTNYTDVDNHVMYHSPSFGFDLPTNNVNQLLNYASVSLLIENSDANFDPIEEVQNSITSSRDIVEDIVQWALEYLTIILIGY